MPARQLDNTTTKPGAQSFDRSEQNPRRVTNLKGLCWLTRDAFFQWIDVNPFQMGAALAYFTLFSMAPVLLIAIAVAGLVFGREASQNQIIGLIEDVVGAQSAGAIQAIIESAGQTPDSGFFATAIGMIFLLLGAAGVVGQLQDSLNTIWRVVPEAGRGIIGFLQDRLVSYSMVLSVGFLLLVSLVLSALLSAVSRIVGGFLPIEAATAHILDIVISFAFITLLFAVIYKYVPNVRIAWGDVWIGAATAALLFSFGKFLIGFYLGHSTVTSIYGAAGSLVTLLLWVYYSSLMFFFGAELTQVYATPVRIESSRRGKCAKLMTNSPERSNLRGSSGPSIALLPSLIGIAIFVLIVASLYWAQAVLIPVALAILLTFLLSPVAAALERIGLGRLSSVILVAVLTFSLLGGIGWIVTLQFGSLANELPKYTGNLRQKIADVRGAAKGGAIEKVQQTVEAVTSEIHQGDEPVKGKDQRPPVIVQPTESFTFWPVPSAVGPMLERFASAGLVIVLVIFMLIQREDLRNRLIRLVGYGRLTFTTSALEEAGQRISRYLLMQTIINSTFGLAVGLVLYLIGMPYAALWGFFAAVLRFIPYVGPFAAAIMPSALSLVVFEGWLWPILVVGIFVAFELGCNMVLEPLLYAESAGVSGVGLLVAVAFWTWLWGPIGLVLATPLTVCVVVFGKYVPRLDFIGVLMSDQPAMESNISYYQRLLAMDQAEATEIVEEHLKTHAAEQIFDAVLIPSLNYARRDRDLGRLTEDGEQFVFRATREILDDLKNLQPNSSSGPTDAEEIALDANDLAATLAKVRILACPARDEADVLALHMFRQLLESTRYEVEVMSDAVLAAEVVAHIGECSPAMILIATVSPGGLGQTRYLCKRLRARFPDLKIAVGRWGMTSEDGDSILLAGADRVGTTMIETREQMIQLCQTGAHSEADPVTTISANPPPNEMLLPEVVV